MTDAFAVNAIIKTLGAQFGTQALAVQPDWSKAEPHEINLSGNLC